MGNTKNGLLSSVALLAGGLFGPAGMLVDRSRRRSRGGRSATWWSLASLLSAFASGYSQLLLTRPALRAVTATAGTGDCLADRQSLRARGRVYAYILGGEVAGTAAGFIISGTVASVISWRAAFVVLAPPDFWLERAWWQTVPQLLRGGQSRLDAGVLDLNEALADAHSRARTPCCVVRRRGRAEVNQRRGGGVRPATHWSE